MIQALNICRSNCYDARYNQAVEAALFDCATPHTMTLYLWANDNAVFIGKNQNAYTECDLASLQADGGSLCRRITGGGAVYHDKGNANFTFIVPKQDYDLTRQYGILLDALAALGVNAEISGRNDITVDGRKCSGSAYYIGEKFCMHHGTVLLNIDYAKIEKYLTASKIKLKIKGVQSVSQRVINLKIDKQQLFDQLIFAAEKVTGLKSADIDAAEFCGQTIDERLAFFNDLQRLMGSNQLFDAQIEHRFEWGTADIRLKLDKSKITQAKIYSDALDTQITEQKEKLLIGKDIKDTIEVIK